MRATAARPALRRCTVRRPPRQTSAHCRGWVRAAREPGACLHAGGPDEGAGADAPARRAASASPHAPRSERHGQRRPASAHAAVPGEPAAQTERLEPSGGGQDLCAEADACQRDGHASGDVASESADHADRAQARLPPARSGSRELPSRPGVAGGSAPRGQADAPAAAAPAAADVQHGAAEPMDADAGAAGVPEGSPAAPAWRPDATPAEPAPALPNGAEGACGRGGAALPQLRVSPGAEPAEAGFRRSGSVGVKSPRLAPIAVGGAAGGAVPRTPRSARSAGASPASPSGRRTRSGAPRPCARPGPHSVGPHAQAGASALGRTGRPA